MPINAVRKNNENIPLMEYLWNKMAAGPDDTAKVVKYVKSFSFSITFPPFLVYCLSYTPKMREYSVNFDKLNALG
jgi:hypothetical protein